MAYEVKLPQWAMAMREGTILQWKKQVGDAVSVGDPLCEVEMDKMVADVESPAEGILLKICAEKDEVVPVLNVICIIGTEGEAV